MKNIIYLNFSILFEKHNNCDIEITLQENRYDTLANWSRYIYCGIETILNINNIFCGAITVTVYVYT